MAAIIDIHVDFLSSLVIYKYYFYVIQVFYQTINMVNGKYAREITSYESGITPIIRLIALVMIYNCSVSFRVYLFR